MQLLNMLINNFKPVWKKKILATQELVINGTDDYDLIRQTARHSIYSEIRQKAVKKLDDQGEVVTIAKTDYNLDVRKTAIVKIKDSSVLLDIAEHDNRSEFLDLPLVTEIIDDKDAYIGLRESVFRDFPGAPPDWNYSHMAA